MRIPIAFWLAVAFQLAAAIPLLAHHSFSAQFDATKHVSFKGIVTNLEWMNPHVWFYVDAPNEKGEIIPFGWRHRYRRRLARQVLQQCDERQIDRDGRRAKDFCCVLR